MVNSLSSNKVVSNYAHAFFDLLQEKEGVSAAALEAETLLTHLEGSEELSSLFKNPLLSKEEQSHLVETSVGPTMRPYVSSLIEKGRLSLTPHILKHFLERARSLEGTTRVTLHTAHAFTSEQKKALTEKLKKSLHIEKLKLSESIHPELLGGFRLFMEGKMLDLSLLGQTHELMQDIHD